MSEIKKQLVNQTIVDGVEGDCARAVIATLLGVRIEQVPHFILFDDAWFDVLYGFMYALGWEYTGCGKPAKRALLEEDSINGFFYGAVPSKTFPGKTHAVVIDLNGVIVHDPNPNKLWQDVNAIESGELEFWMMFQRKKEAA